MNNRDYVRGAYDEIHAPDALFGKVMDMKNKEVKKFMESAERILPLPEEE